MKEAFLHFLWHRRRFDTHQLVTSEGLPLEIIQIGEYNTHAGPDFFNARIKIDDTVWAGNVEMHVRASEWIQHRHSEDEAYENVILHVVWDEDVPIMRPSGERIPCLELKNRVSTNIIETYQQIEQDTGWIPCAHLYQKVPDIIRLNWLDRLLVERMETKTTVIAELLEVVNNHWEDAFYRLLARNFGLKVNAQPFEALAASLPLMVLAKHKNSLLQVEALLFGQAGMLDKIFKDEYPRALAQEYRHLAHKYNLEPIAAPQWKFLRLRPANFPTVRIAQFAALVHQSAHLFSKLLETDGVRQLEHLFNPEISDYWLTHYQFDKPSTTRHKNLGRDFIHLLLINTVAPFLFHYGKMQDNTTLQKRAFDLLEALPAESNTIITGWESMGLTIRSAYQSQAAIHLKTRYCDPRRCLDCAIGVALLK